MKLALHNVPECALTCTFIRPFTLPASQLAPSLAECFDGWRVCASRLPPTVQFTSARHPQTLCTTASCNRVHDSCSSLQSVVQPAAQQLLRMAARRERLQVAAHRPAPSHLVHSLRPFTSSRVQALTMLLLHFQPSTRLQVELQCGANAFGIPG